ncbi:unnamed protein product, partial [marine sediment metagenome]
AILNILLTDEGSPTMSAVSHKKVHSDLFINIFPVSVLPVPGLPVKTIPRLNGILFFA